MNLLKIIVTFSVSLLWMVNRVTSIFCYDCNSAFDPRCGEQFDHFNLGVVNCSLKDPLEHIPPVDATFCRVIKMEIYGKVRIVRKCGYLQDEYKMNNCRKQTGTGELFVTYCSCNTDLCNGASKNSREMALISTMILFSILSVLRNFVWI